MVMAFAHVKTAVHIRLTMGDGTLAWLSELHSRLSALGDPVEYPIDVAQLVRGVAERGVGVDFDCLRTAAANEFRIALNPSEGLLRLMSALRTRDGNLELIDEAPSVAGGFE